MDPPPAYEEPNEQGKFPELPVYCLEVPTTSSTVPVYSSQGPQTNVPLPPPQIIPTVSARLPSYSQLAITLPEDELARHKQLRRRMKAKKIGGFILIGVSLGAIAIFFTILS